MTEMIDCASRPYGAAVKQAGYEYIARYLSDGGASLPGKLLLKSEVNSYLAYGIKIILNWETTADMTLRGYNGGRYDAQAAVAQAAVLGAPDTSVIYYSVDFDATPQQQDTINAYLQACIDVHGLNRLGVYGSYYVCSRARMRFPGIKTWQTQAWSGGLTDNTFNIYQRNNDGYAYVGGAQCDKNTVNTPGHTGAWGETGDSDMTPEDLLNHTIPSAVSGKPISIRDLLGAIDFHTFGLGAPIQPSYDDPSKSLSLAQYVKFLDQHVNELSKKLDTLLAIAEGKTP